MAGAQAALGRIFVSYRREDSAYPAGWLCERLTDHFGRDHVFQDVDSIELGDDFVAAISDAVASCDVLLAVIGADWLTVTGEDGRRRLEDPDDFVRVEIEAGLRRGVRVIPILVDEARMPREAELPPSLSPLVRRHALELSPHRFDYDTSRLLRVLDETVVDIRTGTVPATPSARGDNRVRWILTGLLLAVVLLLLVLAPAVLPTLLASRKSQPQSDAWVFVLWMLPAAPLLASAWLLVSRRTRYDGGALACAGVATLWIASSWALVESQEHGDPLRFEHLVLIVPLLGACVGLFLTIDGARDAVRPNPWGRAAVALTLVLLGTALRMKAKGLGNLVADTAPFRWGLDSSVALVCTRDLIPLMVAGLAAVLRGNAVQSQALRTLVYLQLGYLSVLAAGAAWFSYSEGALDASNLYQYLAFVLGVVCVAGGVRIGQPARRRPGDEPAAGAIP